MRRNRRKSWYIVDAVADALGVTSLLPHFLQQQAQRLPPTMLGHLLNTEYCGIYDSFLAGADGSTDSWRRVNGTLTPSRLETP